jgi:hypothetical protein
MMITRATRCARGRRVCRGMRVAGVAAALALVASPLAHPTIARADFNPDFYQWCMNNLNEGNDYCCAHAGGVVKGGTCVHT